MSFGMDLKQLMQEKGHTVTSLATQSRLTEVTIRRLLRYGVDPSVHPPRSAVLRRVAAALGEKASRLLRLAGYLVSEGGDDGCQNIPD